MNKIKKSAVIYAAGKGTRFEGLPEGQSKCVVKIPIDKSGKGGYITPITGTINALLSRGIYDIHVVVGYGKESVINDCERLVRIYGKDKFKITYVENTKWNYHGCEYSVNLGLRSAINAGAEEIYLIEGDSLVAPELIGRLVDVPHNSVLVRNNNVIDPKKSVVAYGTPNDSIMVTKFWYDQSHQADSLPDEITTGAFYASAQVWKIESISVAKSIVEDYLNKLKEDEPELSAGLGTLNSIGSIAPYLPVFIPEDDGVYNINTKEDYEKIKSILVR